MGDHTGATGPGPAASTGAAPVVFVPHLSYRQGTVADFQAIVVTATAHAPGCVRLRTAGDLAEPQAFRAGGIDVRLAAAAALAAAREAGEHEVDVEARIGACACLWGTAYRPGHTYAQPEDVIYLDGDHAERYRNLFDALGFRVPEPGFDTDRSGDCGDCAIRCDWELYELHGRAWIALHGSDIDLGPADADHTAELGRIVPELRI
jgi:hypothetical protein